MNEFDVKRLALVLALQADIEGMKAFNKQREIDGCSLAYNEGDFSHMAEQLRELAKKKNELL